MADNSRLSRVYGVFQVCADPSDPTKTTGLILPNLTTDQANDLVNKKPPVISNGYKYYDTVKKSEMLWSDGAFVAVSTGPLANEFIFPNLLPAVEDAGDNQRSGFVYYNITSQKSIRTYIGATGAGAFGTIPAAPLGAGAGVGLIVGCSPFALPSGPSGSVEAVGATANQYNGFIYYNSTPTVANVNTVRGRIGGVWSTVCTTTNIATGAGLGVGNSISALPTGTKDLVEVGGNTQDGFTYYSTDLKAPRAYYDGKWHYFAPSLATVTAISSAVTTYPVTISDSFLSVNAHAGGVTLTLPTTNIAAGKTYIIKDAGGDSEINNITISGNGIPIDSAPTVTLASHYGAVRILYTGTIWSTF